MTVQGEGLMDMVDAQGETDGDGERGIHPQHNMGRIHERGDGGYQSPH